MKIKSLELVGFKSFSEKTVINFSDGVTAIVGPNGSGKSNVVDAIRWLLGETAPSFIRTKLLEDIIFSGSESAPPMGMAEVTLIFDNADGPSPAGYENYSEIQLTRRAFRDGESEFFINKTPCRLKDIVELSLDTGSGARGYCIIEQAKVQQIITGKPDETRMLIEEAAGVAKYRMRKKDALRKLETTRQNLIRVSDILLEVKRQLGSIDRQARKAKRYKKLKARLLELEIELLRRKSAKERELEKELEHPLEELVSKVKSEEERIQELKLEEQKLQNTMFGLETDIQTLRQELARTNESFYRLDTEFEGLNREIKSTGDRKEALVDEVRQLDGEVEELKLHLNDLEQNVRDAKEKLLFFTGEPGGDGERRADDQKKLDELRQNQEKKRDELVDYLSRARGLDNAIHISKKWINETERKKTFLTRELEQIRSELERCDITLREEVKREEGLTTSLFKKNEDYQRVSGEIAHYGRENERLERSIDGTRKEREKQESRLFALKQVLESYDHFGETVSYIMDEFQAANKEIKILGVLGELIGVEEGYEKAVEAALGESLKYIVVRDSKDGIVALRALKDSGRGRGSFAPVKLRKRGPRNVEVPAGEGVISSISGILSTPGECKELIEDLLGDVLLVNSVEDAVRLWKTNGSWATYVTLEGDLVLPSGIISGGRKEGSESSILSKKRELAELENQLMSIEKDIAIKETQIEKYRRGLDKRQQYFHELGESKHSLEKEKHSAKVTIEYLDKELEKQKKREKWSEEELSHLIAELKRYTKQNQENRKEQIEINEKATELEKEISLLKDEILKSEREIKELDEKTGRRDLEKIELQELKNRLVAELDSQRKIIGDKGNYKEKISGELQELDLRGIELGGYREKMVAQLKDIASEREDLERMMAGKVEYIAELKEKLQEVGKGVSECTFSLEKRREEISTLREKLAAVRTRRENIYSVARDSYGLENIDQHEGQEEIGVLHDDVLADEMSTTKLQLESIGEVNVSVIEEREELAARSESLLNHKADLETSMGDLEKVIAKIDRESRDKFTTMFHQVNEKFMDLFPKLFTGGKGYLKLTDGETPLEAGVEIIPQPPGKKLKNLSLLSNGEKALTGICLLLSLFFVRPGPFLFLDEVDAPLDEANVDRFNKLIREITDKCQIIMITHKKRTMELADYLYGTTMDRPGVSRIISAQLS